MQTFKRIVSDSIHFSKRDFTSSYKNSLLGYSWIILNPLMMVVLYVGVFGYIFGGTFDGGDDKIEYGLGIFLGLTLFNLIAESLGSSANLILTKRGLVEKVVFPLEVLPVTGWFTAIYKCVIPLSIAIILCSLHTRNLHGSLLLTPLILLPLFMFAGSVYFLFSAFGVYFRDILNFTNLLARGLFFASAIFYPINKVPKDFQIFLYINPIAVLIDQMRSAVLWGTPPDYFVLFLLYLVASLVLLISIVCFRKLKSGFADVV